MVCLSKVIFLSVIFPTRLTERRLLAYRFEWGVNNASKKAYEVEMALWQVYHV